MATVSPYVPAMPFHLEGQPSLFYPVFAFPPPEWDGSFHPHLGHPMIKMPVPLISGENTSAHANPVLEGTPSLRPVDARIRASRALQAFAPILSYGHLPVLSPPHPYNGFYVGGNKPEEYAKVCVTEGTQSEEGMCAEVAEESSGSSADVVPSIENKEEFPDLSALNASRSEKKVKSFGRFPSKNQLKKRLVVE